MATTQQASSRTHKSIIAEHLLSGRTITSWQAITEYRITCLAQRVHDLRDGGVPIQSMLVTENGKRFSRYWVDKADTDRILQGFKQ